MVEGTYNTHKDEVPFQSTDAGRAVEFEEGAWENAEFTEVVSGYPIYTRRPN